MGYTHYWRFNDEEVDEERFTQFAMDVAKLVKLSKIKVQWESDVELPPEITPNAVRFNGIGGDGHETFLIQRTGSRDFNFCKTACKPYDVLVCASLLALLKHFPKVTVNSDGDMGGEDWEPGRDLFEQLEF